jgi:hypothetical protein
MAYIDAVLDWFRAELGEADEDQDRGFVESGGVVWVIVGVLLIVALLVWLLRTL